MAGRDFCKEQRGGLELLFLVCGGPGEEEISERENVSTDLYAVWLAMESAVGEIVPTMCLHSPGGENIDQKPEDRRRARSHSAAARTTASAL